MRPVATRLLRCVSQRRAFSSSSACAARHGFIGLGKMRKLQPSDTLAVFDIDLTTSTALAAQVRAESESDPTKPGAILEVAASAYEASRDANTVVTALPEPRHVEAVYQSIITTTNTTTTTNNNNNNDSHPSSPTPYHSTRLFIDTSTIDPSTSRRVASAVATAHQGTFVDAPMSRGVVGAAAGALTFMLGCEPPLVERARSVLHLMGRRVLHWGPQGAGLSAKLANNYLLALSNIATAEAMDLGIRCGLDPRALAAVINASTGRCWPSEVNNPAPGVVEAAPDNRDYGGGFGVSLMAKDMRLAVSAARDAGANLALADKALAVYQDAEKRDDCKGRDFSVVYRYLGGKEG